MPIGLEKSVAGYNIYTIGSATTNGIGEGLKRLIFCSGELELIRHKPSASLFPLTRYSKLHTIDGLVNALINGNNFVEIAK